MKQSGEVPGGESLSKSFPGRGTGVPGLELESQGWRATVHWTRWRRRRPLKAVVPLACKARHGCQLRQCSSAAECLLFLTLLSGGSALLAWSHVGINHPCTPVQLCVIQGEPACRISHSQWGPCVPHGPAHTLWSHLPFKFFQMTGWICPLFPWPLSCVSFDTGALATSRPWNWT